MKTIEELVEKLEYETCDLRCVDDSSESYHWEIIEHHMSEPKERKIGCGRTAIDALREAFELGEVPKKQSEIETKM